MNTDTQRATLTPEFTAYTWHLLRGLRTRYQRDRDLFSSRECARLEFLRWLYRTGRLVPGRDVSRQITGERRSLAWTVSEG